MLVLEFVPFFISFLALENDAFLLIFFFTDGANELSSQATEDVAFLIIDFGFIG